MRTRAFACMTGLGLVVGGCSIHPLPAPAEGMDTFDIVAQIRCEARSAIVDTVIDYLKSRPGQQAQNMAEVLTRNEGQFRNVDLKSLDTETRKMIERYDGTAIAYEFSFDISEKNDVSGGIGITDVLSRGSLSAGASGRFNRIRQNNRTFVVSDTFIHLVKELDGAYCKNQVRVGNQVYPVGGSIGLREVIKTFIDLNQSGPLRKKENKALAPLMTDQLTFTTTIGGTAGPAMLVLAPVGAGFSVTGAHFTSSNERQDIHRVTISLALEPDEAPKSDKPKQPTDARKRKAYPKSAAETQAIQGLSVPDARKIRDSLDTLIRSPNLR